MKEIYIITIYSGSYINGDENEYVLDECFTDYSYAKEFILKNFDAKDVNGDVYFTLKENAHYSTEFSEGDTAVIHKLNLIR